MKIAFIIISFILVCLIIAYSWFNRDSDRVVLTLITAMTIGALGFITKESISNKKEVFSKQIPIAVFYGLPEYRPLNIRQPYSLDLDICAMNINPDEIQSRDKNIIDIEFAQDRYFSAIQFIVITTIFKKFSHSWNVEAKRTITPDGDMLRWKRFEDPGKEISIKDFFTKMPNNYFVKLGLHDEFLDAFGGKAVFPPNININIDDSIKGQLLVSFSNRYIAMNIRLSKSSSSVGVGTYSKLLGIPSGLDRRNAPESDKYGHSNFFMEIDVSQNWWLNGHPDMKKNRNWANSVAELLDAQFNYEYIRDTHIKQFQLLGPEAIRNINY